MLLGSAIGGAMRLGDPVAVRGGPGRRAARPGRPRARRIDSPAWPRRESARPRPGDVATNRQAAFRYHLLEKWEAGIQLQGSEVKSLRDGRVQLKDAYAALHDGEVWLQNMHIAPYAGRVAREPRAGAPAQAAAAPPRDRAADRQDCQERGLTLVPTRIYFKGRARRSRSRWRAARTLHDKRRDLRDKDQRREIERALHEHGR